MDNSLRCRPSSFPLTPLRDLFECLLVFSKDPKMSFVELCLFTLRSLAIFVRKVVHLFDTPSLRP